MCLTYLSPYDLPYFNELRKQALGRWGDWEAIFKLLSPFPMHFPSELALLAHLRKHPTDFVGALHATSEETRIWAYAYASYLFNRKLSGLIRDHASIPEVLPLITSFRAEDWDEYREFTQADGVELDPRVAEELPFVRAEVPTWPTRQKAIVHSFAANGDLAVLSFSLPKGSYATSFLSNFFILASDMPIVPGVSTMIVDAKKMLGEGNLVREFEYFDSALASRKEEIKKGFA